MAEGDKKDSKRTVLIAVDGSENGSKAFEYYTKQILHNHDRVIVLHAFELPPLPYSSGPCFHPPKQDGGISDDVVFSYYEEWSQMVKETREGHEVMLRSYEDQLKAINEEFKQSDKETNAKKIYYEIIMVVGKPAGEVICQVTKDEKADLVIVGTRGQGVVRRTLLGSVSDYVVHHAHVPVGVIPI